MLPDTTPRCVGRKSLTPDVDVCPVRNTCRRYTDFIGQPNRAWVGVSVQMHLCADDSFASRIPVIPAKD